MYGFLLSLIDGIVFLVLDHLELFVKGYDTRLQVIDLDLSHI